MHCWPYRRSQLAGFFGFFLIGESEVRGQPAAAKKIRNYKPTFVIYASSKDERGIFSTLPRFQFLFLKLLKTCEQRSEIPLREHLLSLSVIKSCSIWETLEFIEQSSFLEQLKNHPMCLACNFLSLHYIIQFHS